MVGKMMILDKPTFRAFLNTPKILLMSRLLLLLIGIGYGVLSIVSNISYISSFESVVLKNFFVPAIFLGFGIIMVFITKLGLTFLLWAGARGFGGPGILKELNRATPVALLPGLLGVPFLVGIGNGHIGIFLLLIVSVLWMYFISVRIIQTTQNLNGVKSYLSVLISFIFLASIYYLVVPTGSLS